MKLQTLFAVVGVLAGCSTPEEPSGPAFDGDAPRVHIVSPARGTIAGDVTRVLVTGTATDDSGSIARVTVNGVPATLFAGGAWWSAEVAVAPGTNLLNAIAIDARYNQGAETRAVVVGPMVPLDGHVTSGIHAALSAQALSTLGHSAAMFIETGGLMTTVQAMNPVVHVGGGPDCLYAQASITSLSVDDADVQMAPSAAGISVSAVLENVRIGMRLQWAVSCVDDSRDVVLSAERVSVQGLLALGVVGRELDIRFEEPDVQITGFDLQLPEVPDEIVQMLALDTAMSVSLGLVTERFVVPMVDRSLAALDGTTTIGAAGMQVEVDVRPTQISFTAEGGTVALDTSLRAQGDNGLFVFVPNVVPAFAMQQGFELAVADDAVNQLLTSMWSAKAFDMTIDFEPGTYGQISELYDSVQLQLAVPPHVEASGNPLQLTIGDWVATFERDDTIAATVVIHAKSALYVVERDDGKLHMDISTPAVVVDVVGDASSITKAQYQAIKSFAFERIHALGSAAVAAIPLPVLGDTMLTSLWVDPQDGYLVIDGSVQ